MGGDLMIENPLQLLGRLRLGREEYCQRLLTMLILNGPYPPWNSRNRPPEQGTRFLQALDALSFGEAIWNGQPMFVDEFDLPRRHELKAGSNPDYALLWDDRLWMVELKTERTSHRPAQLPGYFEFAAHHYPTRRIDLTYLTPSMPLVPPLVPAGMRFAHVTWDQVVPLVVETWGGGDQQQRRVIAMLVAALARIGGSWTTWRAAQLGNEHPAAPEPTASVAERPAMVEVALRLAEATAADGRQRALDYPPAGLEDLQQLRLAVRQAICSAPAGTPIRHVEPWLWSAATSGGRALTESGRDIGYELRLSRNKSPIC
jgi:hypothetical protein